MHSATKAPEPQEPFAIPLETAQQYAENWIEADPQKDPNLSPTDMRAFLVRKKEFIEILSQYDTEYIRMYVGRKPVAEAPGSLEACLVLVSAARRGDVQPEVKGKNPDDIIDLIGTVETERQLSEENYYVFDFSTLCPPACDTESPLFVRPPGTGCR
ncbi:hypothetical protein F5984_11495 [Rudanella paleaurantiibacter]|uniref:Uncharacterized protein n=1 Tax=Rudanella paleaurantiibacter TaxID=2614655 RepID=A0A7J5U0X9_9BACT|nr:hypothetical protein [Rudanella paleaurantiibacter]KAB7731408.1 hypothetical protein F5984_11495 [Rudanella paleaurantiibacter]